jgi:heptosyltransferase-3
MHRLERIDRRVMFWTARRLYSARTAQPPPSGGPDRVLLVRIDERVGNLITLQSLIDALRRKLPGAGLGLLASTRAGQVTRSLSGIDRLFELDKRWFFSKPLSWGRVIGAVREVGYQVALDASAWPEFSFTHAALAYYSGAPVRIGTDRGANPGFHTQLVRPGSPDEYELKQRMRLLEPLGIRMEPPVVRTSLGEARAEKWTRWLEESGVPRPRIGIWPGARKHHTRWPAFFYARLAGRLGGGRVVLWGPGEEKLRDELLAGVPGSMTAAPRTDLADLAALLRGLDLVVCNDTGPMHLAVATGTPTVCLFTSGNSSRWGHPYPHVRNLDAPGGDPAEVDQALGACEELLGALTDRGDHDTKPNPPSPPSRRGKGGA